MRDNPNSYITQWGDKKVLFVMAADAEFGEHMQATGIKPLITGVGLVNAASKLSSTLAVLEYTGNKPDMVINIGTAGAQDLPVNEVYEVTKIRNADMDSSALGIEEGKTPLGEYPASINIPQRFGMQTAECYSTTRYNELVPNKGHQTELEEMEFAAIVDVCNQFDIPAVGLKGVSNNRETIHASSNSWEKYCDIIDEKFAGVVETIKQKVVSNAIQEEQLLAMPPEWHAVQANGKAKPHGEPETQIADQPAIVIQDKGAQLNRPNTISL